MDIRNMIEERERSYLSSYATLSADTKGRQRIEEPCVMRTEFQRDRDRILHCKAFRRLKHKTQVFMAPEDDHFRTRLTHTLEVAQIARSISRCLLLNEDLTEAIALGHDLGHTPFGHACERLLNEVMSCGFEHNKHSLRVVDVLEKDYRGLNLTEEVRDGIVCHTGAKQPDTLEGQVVRLSDKIAYINHDIDDAIRAGIIKDGDLPQNCVKVLGATQGARIDTMIRDVVETTQSAEYRAICMSSLIGELTEILHEFMFQNVYIDSIAKKEEIKACGIVRSIFEYYMQNTGKLPLSYLQHIEEFGPEQTVCDYIAGMTDLYAIKEFEELFVPKVWRGVL